MVFSEPQNTLPCKVLETVTLFLHSSPSFVAEVSSHSMNNLLRTVNEFVVRNIKVYHPCLDFYLFTYPCPGLCSNSEFELTVKTVVSSLTKN